MQRPRSAFFSEGVKDERVSIHKLGVSGACFPGEMLKFDFLAWLEMHQTFCQCHVFGRVSSFEMGMFVKKIKSTLGKKRTLWTKLPRKGAGWWDYPLPAPP